MKASELRHGNLVEYNGMQWTVLSIIYPHPRNDKYSDKWLLELSNGGIITVPLDKCSPIEITEALLKRLGFRYNGDLWYTQGKDSIALDMNDNMCAINGEWLNNITVKFLHQLQNIHLELTGEELTDV